MSRRFRCFDTHHSSGTWGIQICHRRQPRHVEGGRRFCLDQQEEPHGRGAGDPRCVRGPSSPPIVWARPQRMEEAVEGLASRRCLWLLSWQRSSLELALMSIIHISISSASPSATTSDTVLLSSTRNAWSLVLGPCSHSWMTSNARAEMLKATMTPPRPNQ